MEKANWTRHVHWQALFLVESCALSLELEWKSSRELNEGFRNNWKDSPLSADATEIVAELHPSNVCFGELSCPNWQHSHADWVSSTHKGSAPCMFLLSSHSKAFQAQLDTDKTTIVRSEAWYWVNMPHVWACLLLSSYIKILQSFKITNFSVKHLWWFIKFWLVRHHTCLWPEISPSVWSIEYHLSLISCA